MGLRSWFLERTGRGQKNRAPSGASASKETTAGEQPSLGNPTPSSEWELVPAYLPADPREHTAACVIASAIAAGDRPESTFTIRRVSVANPEYQRVAVIATALAAGALATSAFSVKTIYKKKDEEGSHAA